jgi:hypothetical protein
MRVRLGILHFPHRLGCCPHGHPKYLRISSACAEADRRSGRPGLGHHEYPTSYPLGSVSFMNVIIDPKKNLIAIYPIVLFYLFIDWFLIFI